MALLGIDSLEIQYTTENIAAKKENVLGSLGIEVRELTTKEKNQYGIKNGVKVVI